MRRLIGCTLFLLATAGWAEAALGPLEAAAVLAEARSANAKCKFLSAEETEKMGLFAARAEVAAVTAVTAETAGPKLQWARTRGQASACDADAGARVREIYSAADEAMQAVNREQPATGPVNIVPQAPKSAAAAPAPRAMPPVFQPAPPPAAPPPAAPQPQYVYAEPQPEPQYVYAEPQPQPQYAEPAPQPVEARRFLARFSVVLDAPPAQPFYQPQAKYQPQAIQAPVSDPSGGLAHYAIRASAYYVEMRCQHLSQSDALLFWQSIASDHAALLQRETPQAVEAALGEAQARAGGMACGKQSERFVREGFQR